MEQRDNSIVIFKNDRATSDKAPGYKGWGLYKGEPVEIALWLKTDKNGNKFFSGKIQPKQARPPQDNQPNRQPDDDWPV
jgi:hypothetical protein